jgi:hypothetical protein
MMAAFSRTYGIVALVALFSTAGCLRKDLTHTIYVSPTGVTWSAFEKDVRSDAADPANRMGEEQDYILAARAGQHAVARTLRSLGGTRIETTILRRDRPFTVMTDARFGDLAELAVSMIKLARVRGDASIKRNGCEKTLEVWFDAESTADMDGDALADLMSEATSYRLVLTEGRFLRGEGFSIEEDGAMASPGAAVTPEDGIVRAALTWTEGWCSPAQAPASTPQLRNAQLHK